MQYNESRCLFSIPLVDRVRSYVLVDRVRSYVEGSRMKRSRVRIENRKPRFEMIFENYSLLEEYEIYVSHKITKVVDYTFSSTSK